MKNKVKDLNILYNKKMLKVLEKLKV